MLLTAGLLCTFWLPVSWFYRAWGFAESMGIWVGAGDGWLGAVHVPSNMRSFFGSPYSDAYGFERRSGDIEWSRVFRPHVEFDDQAIAGLIFITIPIWLLAAICLAWPVTSFVIARRRHWRGFPVEVTNDKGQNDDL